MIKRSDWKYRQVDAFFGVFYPETFKILENDSLCGTKDRFTLIVHLRQNEYADFRLIDYVLVGDDYWDVVFVIYFE